MHRDIVVIFPAAPRSLDYAITRPRRCRECGTEVSRTAKRCPTCGQPLSLSPHR